MKKFTWLSIFILLTSCATGYQKYTWSGGYKDADLGDGTFQVEYYGNGTTSYQSLETYWNKRAGELCPSGFEVVQQNFGKNNVSFTAGVSSEHPWKKATIKCK